MNHVQISPQWLRIYDFDGDKSAPTQFGGDGNLRKKAEAQFAFHHFFCGFDCFYLQDNIRQQTGTAEKALTESPVAGAAVEKYEGPGFGVFQTDLLLLRGGMRRMAYQD